MFESFSNPTFLNMIVRIVFTICAAYLITSAPKIFADVMQQTNGIDEGGKVQSAVKGAVNEVKDTISGQKVVDAANFARESIKQAIPGYEIALAVKDKIQETKAKVVGGALQLAGKVMKFIPATQKYAKDVEKLGKDYKEKTLKNLQEKKQLREQKKLEGQRFLARMDSDPEKALKDIDGKIDKIKDGGAYKRAKDNIAARKEQKKTNRLKKRKDKKEIKQYRKAYKKANKNK